METVGQPTILAPIPQQWDICYPTGEKSWFCPLRHTCRCVCVSIYML